MDKDRITGAAKDAAGKVEGAFGDLTGDAATKASGRAREAAGAAQNLYGQAKDVARDAGEAAAGMAMDAYEAGEDTLRDGTRAVASSVKENPLGALLLAAGVGFALGMIMAKPPRRSRWDYRG